jgi:hypothetical protein
VRPSFFSKAENGGKLKYLFAKCWNTLVLT